MIAAFLTTVLFSISAVSGQRTARLLGGTEANFWRLVFATLLLALYAHSLGGGVAGAAFPVFLLSGCIGFGIGDVALFQTLPRLGSRLSVVMVLCLSSPLGAVIEWLWLGTALTTPEIVWGLVILAGVAMALTPGKHLELSSRQLVWGILFGLLATFCQGFGAVLSRKAFVVAQAAAEDIDGMTAAYQRILGGVAVSAIFLALVKRRAWFNALTARGREAVLTAEEKERRQRAWPWVMLNAVSGSVLGVSCFQWALKTTPTGVVLPIVAITPLVIIPFSRYVEGEQPTWRSLAGGVVAVTGAVALALTR